MIQGAFLLLGDLLIDISELERTVDEEEGDDTDNQNRQEPTAAPESSIEVEHLCEGVGVELHQQRPEGYQVNGQKGIR